MIGMSSTWMAMKGFGIRESVERCFGLGFGLVEVGAGHKYEPDAVETIIELKRKYPAKQFTIHALFPPLAESYAMNLSDKAEHAMIVHTAEGMFELARRTGADLVGLHSGYCGKVRWSESGRGGFKELALEEQMPRETAKQNMFDVLGNLIAAAERAGVKLALEVSPDGPWDPMPKTPDEFGEVFSRFGSGMFGLLLDVGHLQRSAAANGFDPCEFTARFKDRIFEVHLHDVVDGKDHHEVGTGCVDFARHFEAIGRSKLEALPLVFEYTSLVSEEAALRGKEKIEALLDST